jgi:TPP-dependent pyruvate/acetoin dehydrogenase alpha subunit
MVVSGLLASSDKEATAREIDEEIAEAFRFAKESPPPAVTPWEGQNYSAGSPVADSLLYDAEVGEFNESQTDTVPQPY